MEPHEQAEVPSRQFTLAGLFEAVLWFAVVMGLARLYPDTSDVDFFTASHALPIQCFLALGVFVSLGGMWGAVIGRRWYGLSLGLLVGMPLVVIGGFLQLWWLADAIGSV